MNILCVSTNGGIMLYIKKNSLGYVYCPSVIERHLGVKANRLFLILENYLWY